MNQYKPPIVSASIHTIFLQTLHSINHSAKYCTKNNKTAYRHTLYWCKGLSSRANQLWMSMVGILFKCPKRSIQYCCESRFCEIPTTNTRLWFFSDWSKFNCSHHFLANSDGNWLTLYAKETAHHAPFLHTLSGNLVTQLQLHRWAPLPM